MVIPCFGHLERNCKQHMPYLLLHPTQILPLWCLYGDENQIPLNLQYTFFGYAFTTMSVDFSGMGMYMMQFVSMHITGNVYWFHPVVVSNGPIKSIEKNLLQFGVLLDEVAQSLVFANLLLSIAENA